MPVSWTLEGLIFQHYITFNTVLQKSFKKNETLTNIIRKSKSIHALCIYIYLNAQLANASDIRHAACCKNNRLVLISQPHKINICYYLFIYLLRVTSGLFTRSNLAQVQYNTKHAHYINVNIQTYSESQSLRIAFVKNGK